MRSASWLSEYIDEVLFAVTFQLENREGKYEEEEEEPIISEKDGSKTAQLESLRSSICFGGIRAENPRLCLAKAWAELCFGKLNVAANTRNEAEPLARKTYPHSVTIDIPTSLLSSLVIVSGALEELAISNETAVASILRSLISICSYVSPHSVSQNEDALLLKPIFEKLNTFQGHSSLGILACEAALALAGSSRQFLCLLRCVPMLARIRTAADLITLPTSISDLCFEALCDAVAIVTER